MKKITMMLLLFVSVSAFCQDQDVKIYLERTETIAFDQYDLIKKVNQFYPDLLVSKEIKNNFKNNLKVNVLIDSELIYVLPTDCIFYNVSINPGNYSLDYSYQLKDKTYFSGNVRLFNGSVIRTLFKSNDGLRIAQYYVDGKLINELKS
jgi:hypothetical protein